ncbi:MAG: hypothetical protein ACYC0V_08265 [Armatimonadota bacterium]
MRVPVHVEPIQLLAAVGPFVAIALTLILYEPASKWLSRLWQRIAPIHVVKASVVGIRHTMTGRLLISFSFYDGKVIDLAVSDGCPASLDVGCEGLLTYRGSTLLSFRQMHLMSRNG